jgi:hypothetical protein
MYPQCRYVRPSGGTCHAAALTDSHWCYFHARLQQRQTIRHNHRRPDGRFIALPAPRTESHAIDTVDYGTFPVAPPAEAPAAHCPWENSTLDLPPLEDAVSIQLALIDVAQALAANRIEAKRAGLLLYALQVASANVRNMHLPISSSVRTVTYTDDGTPLAPQDYGYDSEDYEDEDEEEYEEDE